jgi:hypothetical protein
MKLSKLIKKSVLLLSIVPLLSMGTLFGDIAKPTTGGGYGAPRSSDVVNPRSGPNLNTPITSPTQDINRDVKLDRDVNLDRDINLDRKDMDRKGDLDRTQNRIKVETQGVTNPDLKIDGRYVNPSSTNPNSVTVPK